VNRVQGVLERANIHLAPGATDSMGVSGRAILAASIAGRAAPETMAELAKGQIRPKLPLLAQALTGLMRDHHRRLLTLQVAPIDCLDE
jgi:transposase